MPKPTIVRRLAIVGLLALFASVAGAGQRPKPSPSSKPIWSGTSAGFAIRWTTTELAVSRDAPKRASIYSARSLAERDWAEARSEQDDMRCSEERDFEILSIVGPILSVLENSGGYCVGTAHPWAAVRYTAVDLARSTESAVVPARLTDVFAERDVLAALLGDALIANALAAARRPTPKTLAELFAALADSPIRAGQCEFDFDERALSSFAFHHVEKDRVAVRIALPYRHEVCRGQNAQLGILLPVPIGLSKALTAADARRTGFLMKDQQRVARGLSTSFEVTYGPASKEAP